MASAIVPNGGTWDHDPQADPADPWEFRRTRLRLDYEREEDELTVREDEDGKPLVAIPVSGIAAVFAAHLAEPPNTFSPIKATTPPALVVEYTNYLGETAIRRIRPIYPWFGVTKHHPEPQWLLRCYDLDRLAERDYAMAAMRGLPSAA